MTSAGRAFRFGVINERMSSAAAWADHARRVEDQGYATFLVRDHFAPDFFGDQFAPVAALMAAASVTRTLSIGSLVFSNDYRHPVVLAKEAATLDVLSEGRFELGLGAGWLRCEYEQAGVAFDSPGTRVGRLEESLRVLKGLFGGDAFTFAGQHYRIADLKGFPRPIQAPHPPILIGAGSPRMLRLAGREADIVGVLTSSTRTGTLLADPTERLAAAVAEKVRWIREGAGDRFPRVELSMVIDVVQTDDPDGAAEALIARRGWRGITPAQVLEMPAIFIGSREQIVDDMEARRARFGYSYLIVSDRSMDALAPIVARLAGR